MASIKQDNKYFKKSNSYLKNKNINIISKSERSLKEGISESRLVNNNSNIQTLMNILKCKICKNILLNPYDCSKCGNTFCYNCINRLKEKNLPCPFSCKYFEITPSSYGLKKFLNQLKFECRHKNEGCKEIISYIEIENHEKKCSYNFTMCPNNECKQKVKNDNLENHLKNECKYTLFKCKNCGLNLNRKEILLHEQICLQIKEQLDSQSPIINEITKDDIMKNNKDFNSFINILNGLNEDYFYLFNDDKNHKYYYNYSNKGLITLIKCLISLFKYKFGIIENKLIEIDNNIKKVNFENFETITKNNSSTIFDYSNKKSENKYTTDDRIKVINKQNSKKNSSKYPKIEKKIIIKNINKKIDNYNSLDNQKKWETLNLENAKLKQRIFQNNLYNKEKSLAFFHNRQKSNDLKEYRFRLNNNYIKNELFFLGDNNNNFHKNNITRNKSDFRQNMTFTNFIINKKKDIEQKILGNRLNKSSSTYNNINSLNNSNYFNRSNMNNSYGFFLNSKEDDKIKINGINRNKSFNQNKTNIYEKKVLNVNFHNEYK